MPARHRRSAAYVRGQRRKLVWATLDQSVNIPAGNVSNTNLLALLAVAGSSLLGCTVMRTHVRITSMSGAVANDLLRVGLIVARVADVGLGVAGAVTAADPELDWMLLDRRVVRGQLTNVDPRAEYEYDVRSKRKLQELNQAYVLSLVPSSAAASVWQLWARTLIALP